jgi:uncharacterized ParB-like nuclease family protein
MATSEVLKMQLATDNILASAATQVRKKLDKTAIESYIEALENGAQFPPLVVFAEDGGQRYILADGFHRLHAYINAGAEKCNVEVHEGGLHDALMWALGANDEHGLRRTNADKRNAVEMALKDPEISTLHPDQIALICRVNERTVRRIRDDMDLAKPKNKPNSPGKAQPADPKDVRPTKPLPTQEEIDRDELRQALGLIKAFPYGGEDVTKLDLNKDDTADLEYVAAWCSHAVLVLRSK